MLLTATTLIRLATHILPEKSLETIVLFGSNWLLPRVLGDWDKTLIGRECYFPFGNHYSGFLRKFKTNIYDNGTHQFFCSVSLDNNIKSQLRKKCGEYRRK